MMAMSACTNSPASTATPPPAAAPPPDASSPAPPDDVSDAAVPLDVASPEDARDAAPPPEPEWVPPAVATRSRGCGIPRPAAVGATHTTPGGRTLHVWGPSGYDPGRAYPVVIVFHGWYANGRAHQSWFEMEKYVDNEAMTVYPDAINGLWDLDGTTDLVFFDEMVSVLSDTYCINPSRVLGFGFSYGGKFANHLGCKRAGYVKAISIGDGSWGGDGLRCGRLPVLVTHRTRDPDEFIQWGRDVANAWKVFNGCAANTTTEPTLNCTTNPTCRVPGGPVTFCEDTFFDPAWPAQWNHTVREPYRSFTYRWFKALP